MTQQEANEDRDLPTPPRENRVPPHGEVPSRGFLTPHERGRFEAIETMTDTRTAIQLYTLAYEGGYGNLSDALEAAVNNLQLKTHVQDYRWRYYCDSCDFIGGVSKTFTEAEHSASRHDSIEGCDSVVFSYHTDDWDSNNVEALVAAYLNEQERD